MLQVAKGPKTIEDESVTILRTRNYSVLIKDAITGSIEQVTYNLEADDLPLFRAPQPEDEDKRNHRVMKNKAHFQTSVRKLTDSTFFFPSKGLFSLICYSEMLENSTDIYKCNIDQISDIQSLPSIKMNKGVFDVKIKSAPNSNPANTKVMYVTDIKAPTFPSTQRFMDIQCSFDVSKFTLLLNY